MKLQVSRGLLTVALAAAMMSLAGASRQNQKALDQRFIDFWKQQPRVTLPVTGPAAKVVIVKFNDWMCPGCKYWYEQLKPVMAKYEATPGALKYVEKDWPWNSECNPAVQTIHGHEASCAAAAAVRLAADRGKRDAMVDWLYANQPETEPDRQAMLARVKAKTGEMLGIKDVSAADASKLADIRKDIDAGVAAQVRSTPTYFINGVRASDPDGRIFQLHYVEVAIQYELSKK